MVQWQRHILPILRHIGKRAYHANDAAADFGISRIGFSFSHG
ncbi:50S ribosomal protein L22 [Senna tora]|uniref:50S ribosomal protein L22 n=1 Tax=Senna tora TaxID=362788 RepID=A0A834SV50_9FABA|nr:50S ribosomal protein L22 [Senna tora]